MSNPGSTPAIRVGTLNGSGFYNAEERFKYSVVSIRQIMRERKLNVIILTEVNLSPGKGKELATELRGENLECAA